MFIIRDCLMNIAHILMCEQFRNNCLGNHWTLFYLENFFRIFAPKPPNLALSLHFRLLFLPKFLQNSAAIPRHSPNSAVSRNRGNPWALLTMSIEILITLTALIIVVISKRLSKTTQVETVTETYRKKQALVYSDCICSETTYTSNTSQW